MALSWRELGIRAVLRQVYTILWQAHRSLRNVANSPHENTDALPVARRVRRDRRASYRGVITIGNIMRTSKTEAALLFLLCSMSLFLPVGSHAWEPNANDLAAAITAGDFAGYHANISAWLSQKVPAGTGGISEAALRALLKEPVVADALAQRELISKVGPDKLIPP